MKKAAYVLSNKMFLALTEEVRTLPKQKKVENLIKYINETFGLDQKITNLIITTHGETAETAISKYDLEERLAENKTVLERKI